MDQRELVERAMGGDHDALAILAGTLVARLDAAARLILRDPELARDAVQEGFIGAWRNLPTLRDPDRFEATSWIAPDGKTVFAVYHDNGVDDGMIWSIDVATGEGHELSWPAPDSLTWQRVGS